MKKFFALVLALIMALSCTLALAEQPAPEFSGLTISSELDVDREVLGKAMTTFGVDENIAKIADLFASVLDESGCRIIVADGGIQYDLLLKDKQVLTAGGEATNTGIILGSNLIPSYAISISIEEILDALKEAMNEKFDAMASNIVEKAYFLDGLDVDGITKALNDYTDAITNAVTGAISYGEPQTGDFVLDGISYNAMVPINVDLTAVLQAYVDNLSTLAANPAISAALEKLAYMGVNIDLSGIEGEKIDPATVPEIKVEMYMTIDEQGNAGDTIDTTFTLSMPGSEDALTMGDVLLQGNAVKVNVNFLTANTTVLFSYEPSDTGAKCELELFVNDLYFAAKVAYNMGDAITVDSELYVLDSEKPLVCEHDSLVMEGKRTQTFGDDLTVVTLDELADEESGVATGLLMDLLLNGAGNVVAAATEAMPEETNAIMELVQSLTGGSEE